MGHGHDKDGKKGGCGTGCGCDHEAHDEGTGHEGHGHGGGCCGDHHRGHDEHAGGCCGGHGHHHHHEDAVDEDGHGGCCGGHHGHHHHDNDHDHGHEEEADIPFFNMARGDQVKAKKAGHGLILPRVIGHRGACGYAPENTIESIRTAAALGIEWIEFDVKLTADHVPMLFHDDMLERTSSGFGPFANAKLEDIRALDAGSWYADGFAGIGIPTLEEALEVIIELGLAINMEIKPCPGREVETAEVALDILSRVWDEPERLIVSSFSEVSLEVAKDMAPEWARGYLIDEVPQNWREMVRHLQAATVNINGNRPETTQGFIEEIIDEGYGILAYTVNDPAKARQLLGWGVDGVFTDLPDVLAKVLITRH